MTVTLVMAPVRGISDLIYRNTFVELFSGIDEATTPFLNALRGNKVKPVQLQEMIPGDNSLPITPQIIGKDPAFFIPLAKKLHEMGHEVINWNVGCPFPTMTKKGCGAGLLPHPEAIKQFLDEVCGAIPGKLSVKIRLGLNDNSELATLMPLLNNYPLAELIIHPRTGKQMYKGSVDLDAFESLLEKSKHPVVYNGDINTLADFQRVQERFPGIQKYMLGRGLFANPMLASEIKNNELCDPKELSEKIFTFHDALHKRYSERLSGPSHLYHKMTGHWEYLHRTLPKGKKFYKRLTRLKSISDYDLVVAQFESTCK